MQKIWNYLLYSTWRLLNFLGEVLFRKPIHFIMLKIFPSLKKNEKRALDSYNMVMNGKDFSFNMAYAYGQMFMTTMIIYAIILLYFGYFFKVDIGDKLYHYFLAIVVLSYLTNQMLSWRNDKYLVYFSEFDIKYSKRRAYITAILFHLGVFSFAILSIYVTIGFNF